MRSKISTHHRTENFTLAPSLVNSAPDKSCLSGPETSTGGRVGASACAQVRMRRGAPRRGDERERRAWREHVDTETCHSRKANWDVSVTNRTVLLSCCNFAHICSLSKAGTTRASRPALQRLSFCVNPPPSPAPPHSCLCVCAVRLYQSVPVRLLGSAGPRGLHPAGVDKTQDSP